MIHRPPSSPLFPYTTLFRSEAFSRSTTYGTSPRNPVVGPGLHTFDLSASKSFKIVENHSLLFRTELFNADRKSTRLNSSHSQISYAVFCLKKKINHRIYTYH